MGILEVRKESVDERDADISIHMNTGVCEKRTSLMKYIEHLEERTEFSRSPARFDKSDDSRTDMVTKLRGVFMENMRDSR